MASRNHTFPVFLAVALLILSLSLSGSSSSLQLPKADLDSLYLDSSLIYTFSPCVFEARKCIFNYLLDSCLFLLVYFTNISNLQLQNITLPTVLTIISHLDDTVALILVPCPPLSRGSAALTACLGSCPQGFPFLPPAPFLAPPCPLPQLSPTHQCCCMPFLYQALSGCWGSRGDGSVVPVLKGLPASVPPCFLRMLTSNSLMNFLLWYLCPLVWGLTRAPRNTSQELKPTSASRIKS